jgi:peptide/nickel transport system substrate-binding protein
MATRGSSEPASMDAQVDPYANVWLYNQWVTGNLVTLTPEGEYKPGLATEWKLSADSKSWTLTLMKGQTFMDGTPFNAQAVKFNIDRLMDPATNSALMANYVGVKEFQSTEVVDEYTVKINYKNPVATVLWGLSVMPVWSPTAVQKFGKDFHQNLVGLGPYKMTEWVKASHIKFVKDPNYKGPRTVNLDSITVRFVGEDAVLGEILKTAEANMGMEMPAQSLASYKGNASYTVTPGYQPGTGMQFTINTSKAPFTDLKVRQALRHAYDGEVANKTLYDGNYVVVKSPLTRFTRCYWAGAETVYKYDPEKAKALLEEAGWKVNPNTKIREKDGKPLTFTISMLHHQELGEWLSTQFRAIGADMKVEVIPGPVQLERAIKGDFDIIYQRLRGFEPDSLYDMWFSQNLKPGGWAWSRFVNARLDEVVSKANASADPKERCDFYTEAQKILTDNAPGLPTLDSPIYYVLKSNVKGFKLGAIGSTFIIDGMYVEK